ncbi:Protein of unknown function, DUF393 [Roseovarius marisflavi]|uniref:DUF393 domain-containing protein n=1 Tax=Roseovarius marisflavi TaxID=1054996 RepID=A0A1M7CAV9_9RHOB|nr:DUF393 domain-containing protein [Roseovarius marisflavi]SHL64341.1 Protein of unknown function, DUF393 [Roseovarius marisflavi]
MTRETQVLYNARCPVCRAEIDHYAGYARRHDLSITFHDLNSHALEHWGISADAAARRLHVRQGGRVTSGVEAFVLLWSAMPRYRLVARMVGLPGLRHLAGVIYNRILAPRLYARHLARERRNCRNVTL